MKSRANDNFVKHVISAPIIFSAIIPFILLDLWVEVYHRTCFPLYGMKYVDRSKYIKIDRYKLPYLNGVEKVNCTYCGYGNGLMAYISEIVARTEEYWCGIKHSGDNNFEEPGHHSRLGFVEYEDETAFVDKYIQKDRVK